jgi:hypothetical protein
VKPATLETIEDQLPQVFDRRTKPASWPDGVVVLRGDMDDHSNDTLEDDAFDPEGNLTGLSSLPDSKSPVQERLKRVHDELSEMFGPGDFPGAPTSTDGRQVLPPTDCYAFYLPWHHFPEQTWEIYLLVEIDVFAKQEPAPFHQLLQRRDIRSNPPRLVAREPAGGGSATRLILAIDVGERLAVLVADDGARVGFFGRPRWREAARTHVFRSFSLNHLPP